jgi:hypothetical protein
MMVTQKKKAREAGVRPARASIKQTRCRDYLGADVGAEDMASAGAAIGADEASAGAEDIAGAAAGAAASWLPQATNASAAMRAPIASLVFIDDPQKI